MEQKHSRLPHLVTATAVALALSSGALAQQNQGGDVPQETKPVPAQPEAEAAPQQDADQQLEGAQQRLQDAEEQAAGQTPAEGDPAAKEEVAQEAADEQAPSAPEETYIAQQQEGTLLASELQGLAIVGADGEEIGEIEDLILHPEGGIFGATVAVGGFLGVGGKEVALSWKEFKYAPEEQVARVAATRTELEEAPDFKSLADIRAEQEAAAAQERAMQQQQQGGVPSSAPTTSQ